MDLKTAERIKAETNRYNQVLRGILLGAVESPAKDAGPETLSLEDRYNALCKTLADQTKFRVDYNDPSWRTAPAVCLNPADNHGGDGPTKLMLRFRWRENNSRRGPDIVYAELFDSKVDGATFLHEPYNGFPGDAGQMLAIEYIARSELPEDSQFIDALQPGEDPRTPEQRMTLVEQSLSMYLQAQDRSRAVAAV